MIGEGVGADPDGAVNADAQGDLQRVIEDVSGPNLRGASRFGCAGGEDADRSGPADEYFGAGDPAGPVQRVQADCQRFGQHSPRQRESVGQRPDLVLPDDHVFGEPALGVGEAGRGPEVAGVATHVADPGEAFRAVSAGSGRVDCHRGSGGKSTGRVVLDPPDDLVTEHQWLLQVERAYGAVLVVVQIRSTDAAMGIAHEDLPGFWYRGGQVVESQIASPVNDESLHECVLFEKCQRGRDRHGCDKRPLRDRWARRWLAQLLVRPTGVGLGEVGLTGR